MKCPPSIWPIMLAVITAGCESGVGGRNHTDVLMYNKLCVVVLDLNDPSIPDAKLTEICDQVCQAARNRFRDVRSYKYDDLRPEPLILRKWKKGLKTMKATDARNLGKDLKYLPDAIVLVSVSVSEQGGTARVTMDFINVNKEPLVVWQHTDTEKRWQGLISSSLDSRTSGELLDDATQDCAKKGFGSFGERGDR